MTTDPMPGQASLALWASVHPRTPPRPRKPASGHLSALKRPITSQCRPDCHRPKGDETHCPGCHQSTATPEIFDRHRRGGRCLDPAILGLVEVGGVWREVCRG